MAQKITQNNNSKNSLNVYGFDPLRLRKET